MLVNWLLSRLKEGSGRLESNQLYQRYRFETIEQDHGEPVGFRYFIDHLTSIFPGVTKTRQYIGKLKQTFYTGICLQDAGTSPSTGDFSSVIQFLSEDHTTNLSADRKEITMDVATQFTANGLPVIKHVHFLDSGEWKVCISGKEVDLKRHSISNRYLFTTDSVRVVVAIVQRLGVCSGVQVTNKVSVSRFHTLDNWQDKEQDTCIRTLRSLSCYKVLPFNNQVNTCKMCQHMTFSDKENKVTSNNENVSVKQQFKKLIPGASEEMLSLLIDQSKNCERTPSGRRWSKNVISVCLQLYTRSPHGYAALRASNMLLLPSPSLLILYKNSVKQEVGFNEHVFKWMYEEASRKGLNEAGWSGGLIFDEMAIQSDLQLSKCGKFMELTGFTDIGDEGNMCSTFRAGCQKKALGTHILQLVFLGTTGFRFPIAHFVTHQIQGYELYTLFWVAVDKLEQYGFRILYTSMDGAQCNRTFMNLHLNGNQINRYTVPSPSSSRHLVFMMDFSHVVKKIRNNILKSGFQKHSTRLLTLPSGQTVQWKMWVDAFEWDQQNCLSLHRKLTNEHFNLNNHEKMRNHLAEQVLDHDMLNLMKNYQEALGPKGEVLSGAIELITHTSTLISIFRDMRPIVVKDDHRLKELADVCYFFAHWKDCADKSQKKDRYKSILSLQCHEDIQACGIGFIELCHYTLHQFSKQNVTLTPGLVNSDIVENHFNQQRSTFHGANTNRNVLQYSKAQNAVIISQAPISRKANAARSHETATPCVELRRHLPSKRKTQDLQGPKKIKSIRF